MTSTTISKKSKKRLYSIFRDLEDVYASSYTSIVALRSISKAVQQLRAEKTQIIKELIELIEIIKTSEPRIFPLVHLIEDIEEKAKALKSKGISIGELKKQICTIISNEISLLEKNIKNIADYGAKEHITNKDFIIIHSVSMPVVEMIIKAKKLGKRFKVLVLKQDFNKTKQLIKRLKENSVEFVVVPEYNLTAFIDKVSKLFIGALTLSSDNKLITAVGTSNIVSLCKLSGVPVYLFINTLKFSHKKCCEQSIHRKRIRKKHETIEYDLVIHSHEAVELKHIDRIITEKGEISKSTIKKLRQQKKC